MQLTKAALCKFYVQRKQLIKCFDWLFLCYNHLQMTSRPCLLLNTVLVPPLREACFVVLVVQQRGKTNMRCLCCFEHPVGVEEE